MPPMTLAAARPPAVSHPLLVAAHAATFGLPYRVPTLNRTAALPVKPAAPPAGPAAGVPRRQAWRAVAPIAATRAHGLSRNWAGAIVPASGGARFSLITASWTVPRVANPPGLPMSYVSIWAGLGGSYRASRSMPQIGSEHGWDGTKLIHRLWCQWWRGDGNAAGYLSHWIPDLPMEPGDPITVWLEVDPAGTTVTFHWAWKNVLLGAEETQAVPVMADTANWVVERPTQVIANTNSPSGFDLGDRHPLPEFRSAGVTLPSGDIAVTMTNCLARLGPAPASETVRRPLDSELLSLHSIAPGTSRSFIDLEPAMTIDPKGSGLAIVRHLP